MKRNLLFLTFIFFLSCRTTTYYIVRHAEKETIYTMATDVPLSQQGEERARALADSLYNSNIRHIYVTQTVRAILTAQPLADTLGLPIETYELKDAALFSNLRQLKNGNVLIVGHSNTVDNLVNTLAGTTHIAGELPETQYGDLFIIRKRGNRYFFERSRFGR